MQFKLFRQTFNVSFFLIVAYLLIVTLLLNLGFWQLNRAEEKRVFLRQQKKQLKSILNLTVDTNDIGNYYVINPFALRVFMIPVNNF